MDGTALIFCEGAFGKREGKVANALVRWGRRYEVLGVLDRDHAGRTAGDVVEGASQRIPIFADISQASQALEHRPDFLVVGLSPDYGRMQPGYRRVVIEALRKGMSVDSPLRPYLQEDPEFPGLAMQTGARLRSVGMPQPLSQLRDFTGEIERVTALKVAVVGTSLAAGNLTTAWMLTEGLRARAARAELVGTSETSWLQGVPHTVVLETVVAKYVAGEIEGLVVRAWEQADAEVLVLEGQGSVALGGNAAGLALLTAARPDAIVVQHAPNHHESEASDRFGAAALDRHIRLYELLSERPVVAIAMSHEGMEAERAAEARTALGERFDLPVVDVLAGGAEPLADIVLGVAKGRRAGAART